MNNNLEDLVNKIGQCIFTIRNPLNSQEERKKAHLWLDEIIINQNDFNFSLEVAFKLITNENSTDAQLVSFIKHFGLQLIENRVKYNWSNLSEQVQKDLKLLLERLTFEPSYQLKERYLKDCLSKCVVETMKREWPQKWPLFLNQMLLSKRNEIVLFILGRLIEDVAIFLSPSNSERRREIHSELLIQYTLIMQYIGDCLISGHIELCIIALETLNPFLEWASFDSDMLSFLCDILNANISNEFQPLLVKSQACDCLLTCLNRKGLKAIEKQNLLILFSDQKLGSIFKCLEQTLFIFSTSNNHQAFDLAKRLCNLISLLGQVVSNFYPEYKISDSTWKLYLQQMYSLLKFDNQILNSFVLQFWRDFVKNIDLRLSLIDPQLTNNLLFIFPNKMIKKSWDNDLMGFEFDNNEDYETFYYKFRAELLNFLRSLTLHNQNLCFSFVSSFFIKTFNSTLPQNDSNLKLEWEMIAHMLEAVCGKLTKYQDLALNGLNLLSLLLSTDSNLTAVEIISSQLSCISALTIFLPYSKDTNTLNRILQKIFTLATFDMPGQVKQSRCKFVKSLRRHACFYFIKLCQKYSKLLLPLFPILKDHINSSLVNNKESSQMEICAFNEGLLLLSNNFEDLKTQQNFIQEIIFQFKWFLEFFPSIDSFVKYLGLNQNPDDYDQFGLHRAQLVYVNLMLLGLLKRVNNKDILLPTILPFIHPLSNLVSILNSLWDNKVQETCHSLYKEVVFAQISDSDKISLLELSSQNSDPFLSSVKSSPLRMQQFLWSLFENACSILGQATFSLNPEIYLEYKNFNTVISQIYHLPNSKLRIISRTFVKPLITNCPNILNVYSNTLLLFLKDFLPFFFNRVNSKWEEIKTKRLEGREQGDMIESELIDEKLVRLLSRDFIDIVFMILLSNNQKKPNQPVCFNSNDFEMVDCDENKFKEKEEKLSDLGIFAINHFLNIITMTIFVALTWLDSLVSYKAALVCIAVLKKLIFENIIKNVTEVEFFLDKILKAFSYFGEHEQNQSILLQLTLIIYEGLIVKNPFQTLKLSLSTISGCDLQKWNDFEIQWIHAVSKPRTSTFEKKRREALKNLLKKIIGKNVGQLGKKDRDESIRLPPLRKKNVSKNSIEQWNNLSLDLSQLFVE